MAETRRRAMVEAVRRGVGVREAARRFHVSHSTVLGWLRRAGRKRLTRVVWADRPSGPRRPANHTAADVEQQVLALRRDLKKTPLGECGARAIHAAMQIRGMTPLPSVRTLGRILARHGALDGRHRLRRPAPPRGWYLPDVARGEAELDSFDVIEDLVIRGGLDVDVLTGISLYGALSAAWPRRQVTAQSSLNDLIFHWREFGLPRYAQFDNDNRFQGPHHYRDVFGRVMRLCLSLDVTPVFVPVRESGFQASIENFNGRWERAVWSRRRYRSRGELERHSAAYVRACRDKQAERIERAPRRRPFPKTWQPPSGMPRSGRVIFLRRTDGAGAVQLLGRRFKVARLWVHRLVRAEVDLAAGRIRFYRLRRREPDQQPLLKEVHYQPPE
jgi:putative transposase